MNYLLEVIATSTLLTVLAFCEYRWGCCRAVMALVVRVYSVGLLLSGYTLG
ncbi:MAG: hypothetical protein ACO2O2_16740 [Acidilobaceae archaeon]